MNTETNGASRQSVRNGIKFTLWDRYSILRWRLVTCTIKRLHICWVKVIYSLPECIFHTLFHRLNHSSQQKFIVTKRPKKKTIFLNFGQNWSMNDDLIEKIGLYTNIFLESSTTTCCKSLISEISMTESVVFLVFLTSLSISRVGNIKILMLLPHHT